jgi:catechol 1,2-dioxygenase
MTTTEKSLSTASRRGFISAAVASAAATIGTAEAAQCGPTGGDILGPFYRPSSAASAKVGFIQLAKVSESGKRLTLTGRVLRPDCKTPVANAVVDAWQANEKGAYDVKTPDEVIAPENYNLRGQTRTNEKGEFVIDTVMPGKYNIPPGLEGFEKYAGKLRPAHVHLTITHPVYLPLTTQVYFQNDSQIKDDPWAKHSELIAKVSGNAAVVNIVLGNTPPIKRHS